MACYTGLGVALTIVSHSILRAAGKPAFQPLDTHEDTAVAERLLFQWENDGMVSLASARWGEYLGTVHADHFAQTPDMKFVHPAEDFDALGFYVHVLENLARRGF